MKRFVLPSFFIFFFIGCGSPAAELSSFQKTEKFIAYYLQPSVIEAEIGAGPGSKPSDWLRGFLTPQFSASLLREGDAYADSSPAPKLPKNFLFVPAGSGVDDSRAVTQGGEFHYILLEADDAKRLIRMRIFGASGAAPVHEKEFLFSGKI